MTNRRPSPVQAYFRRISQPRRRQAFLMLSMLLVLVLIAGRLTVVQLRDGAALAAEGLNGRMRHSTEPARRGDIVTADGTVLATDAPRYWLEVNPARINAPNAVRFRCPDGERTCRGAVDAAKTLAPMVGSDEAELLAVFTTGTAKGDFLEYVPWLESVPQALWNSIKAVGIDGIIGHAYYERTYPAETVAGNIIGFPFFGPDDERYPTQFSGGLEATENEALSGQAGESLIETGANGQPIPGGVASERPVRPGCDVRLTIDAALQWKAQNAVDAQVEEMGAESGMVIALDTQTGEILALVDSDTKNPLDIKEQDSKTWGSKAVRTAFEPGSTGKVITMAMVLETGEAKPTSTYSVPWTGSFGGQEFKDHQEHATTNWTLNGILANSSNVGTLMAAQNVPDQTRYDFLKKFGLGTATGVELEQEHPGIVNQPGTAAWDGRTRNAVLFGQAVSLNALQDTAVYSIIGNDGVAMPIHLVKAVECSDGTITPTEIGSGKRVVSSDTAATLRAMLESVVDDGTGKTAQIPDYRVAGKTGTAERFENGVRVGYTSSFIGLAPAENPRIAVAAIFVNAEGGNQWGSTVAAPVFTEVMSFALQRLNVPPSTGQPAQLPTTW